MTQVTASVSPHTDADPLERLAGGGCSLAPSTVLATLSFEDHRFAYRIAVIAFGAVGIAVLAIFVTGTLASAGAPPAFLVIGLVFALLFGLWRLLARLSLGPEGDQLVELRLLEDGTMEFVDHHGAVRQRRFETLAAIDVTLERFGEEDMRRVDRCEFTFGDGIETGSLPFRNDSGEMKAFAREVWRMNPAVRISYIGIEDDELRQLWLSPIKQRLTRLEVMVEALNGWLRPIDALVVGSVQAVLGFFRRRDREL
jgi:hypothetical protein